MNLLAQMLMGGGSTMYQGKGLTGAAAVGMQQMGAQSMRNTLRKLLSGLPEGGKLAMTSGGPVGDNGGTVNLSLPMTSMADTPESVRGALAPTESNIATPAKPAGGGGLNDADLGNLLKLILGGGNAEGRWPNPSSSPLDVSNADLVGLTPENVVQALHGRQTQEELGLRGQNLELQRAQHALDIPYKMAQIQHLMRGDTADQPFPVQVPGVGTVTNKQWAEIPQNDRAYALYVHTAKQLGPDAKIMSRNEWEMYTPTDHIKMLKQMQVDPSLLEMETNLRKASATNVNIGENVIAKQRAESSVSGLKYFSSNWTKELDEHMGSKATMRAIRDSLPDIPAKGKTKEQIDAESIAVERKAKMAETIKFIRDKIASHEGQILGYEKTGPNTITWTVKWPSGDTKKISYTFR